MYFKIRKFTSQNLVYQAAVFCVGNAPKVTYERLRFEKFFRGLYPRTPVKKGREDMRKERRGGEGESSAPSLQASAPRFPWAGYGPVQKINSFDKRQKINIRSQSEPILIKKFDITKTSCR
jgi:hypothetical protein